MTFCHIIGDCIAMGLAMVMPLCTSDATKGIPSHAVIERVIPTQFLVVSAGTNDPLNPKLAVNLEAIRVRATGKVIWIVPMQPRAAQIVIEIAREHGDKTVRFIPGKGHGQAAVHPQSYEALATSVRNTMEHP